MDAAEPLVRNISDTALWTAALRAGESERADAIFCDPYARRLAGERGFEIARAVKNPAVKFGVALRTAAIDRLILASVRERGCDTVMNLAAGLDVRAWRLDLPESLRWVDVDMPDLIDYKTAVLGDEPTRCRYESVRLDLADRSTRRELFESLGAASKRVLVLTEGLLAYLEPDAVAELATDLHAQPTFAEWATDLATSNVLRNVRSAGHKVMPADVRTRFAPEESTRFFEPYGWREAEFVDLFWEAPNLGRDHWTGKLLRGAVRIGPKRMRASLERGLGIARLERE